MTDPITYIRWQHRRRGRSPQWSLWHIATDSLSNRYGKTGCGRKFRRTARIEERDTVPDEAETCENCSIALESEPM